MNENQFQELLWSGLGRAIVYARENDVRPLRDAILDACLHCYSADPQSEGTRADYMFELVNFLPDRQFYRDEVLKGLPGSGDDWHAAQRFRFATCMAFEGDDRAKHMLYDCFEPGPRMGEAIAINFLQMDGLKGFVFAAAKIGALIIRSPREADLGWLWSKAVETFGEEEAHAVLREAGAVDPKVEAYRLQATAGGASPHRGDAWEEIKVLTYEQLRPRLGDAPARWLSLWGKAASTENLERAAQGLVAARDPGELIQHLRIFSRRAFPLDPIPLLDCALSTNDALSNTAAVAVKQLTHPSVRDVAFRLISNHLAGRQHAIAMLDKNWEPNDHDVVLRWFEGESDRDARHHMGIHVRHFWEHHPEPAAEPRMLLSLYERGPCSFCREVVVKRLSELDSLSAPLREECAYDANEDIRLLIEPDQTTQGPNF
jgi:hypothetical protein